MLRIFTASTVAYAFNYVHTVCRLQLGLTDDGWSVCWLAGAMNCQRQQIGRRIHDVTAMPIAVLSLTC